MKGRAQNNRPGAKNVSTYGERHHRQQKKSLNSDGTDGVMKKFRDLDDLPTSWDDVSFPTQNNDTNIEETTANSSEGIVLKYFPINSFPLSIDTVYSKDYGDYYSAFQEKYFTSRVDVMNKGQTPNCDHFEFIESKEQEYADEVFNDEKEESSDDDIRKQKQIFNNPPPLPCEKPKERELTDQEKLVFSKKPRPVDFKPYTLSQYKMIKPKEYVQISNLKPDLQTEELIAKRSNRDRIKQFSSKLKVINQESIRQQPKLPSSGEKNDIKICQDKLNSKRQKALEFARNIPKPSIPKENKVKAQNERKSEYDEMRDLGYSEPDLVDENPKLRELEANHEQSRMQIEAIRKSMGLK